jgi:hypothetical protein
MNNRACGRGSNWGFNANYGPFYWNNNTVANTNTNIGASLSYLLNIIILRPQILSSC